MTDPTTPTGKRLDTDLPTGRDEVSREEVVEQFAALEIAVNAIEDRLEVELPGARSDDLSLFTESLHRLDRKSVV